MTRKLLHSRRIVTTERSTITLDKDEILKMLFGDAEPPKNAHAHVTVPGGGDWSNCTLDLAEVPVHVSWTSEAVTDSEFETPIGEITPLNRANKETVIFGKGAAKPNPCAVLRVDDKWSIMYDETNNDMPVAWLRHGEHFSGWDEKNSITTLFYALLEAKK